MFMYRYQLYKRDELEPLLADDFSAPVQLQPSVIEDGALREINRAATGKKYEEYDKFGVIDYRLEVYEHAINYPNQGQSRNGPFVFPIYLIGPSEFRKKPELNYNVA